MPPAIVTLALIALGPLAWGTISWYVLGESAVAAAVDDPDRYMNAAILLFTVTLAAALLALLDAGVSFELRPVHLAVVPFGAAMYAFDDRIIASRSDGASGRPSPSAAGALLGLAAPLPEELVYRWGLFAVLGGIHPALFVAASAAVFGLHHFEPGRDVELALKAGNGLVYSVLFVWTGSVLVAALCHGAYNATYLSTGWLSGGR